MSGDFDLQRARALVAEAQRQARFSGLPQSEVVRVLLSVAAALESACAAIESGPREAADGVLAQRRCLKRTLASRSGQC
jgi:hypothetical protein